MGSDRGTKKISGKWGRTCSASQEEPDLLSVSPACVFFFFLSYFCCMLLLLLWSKKVCEWWESLSQLLLCWVKAGSPVLKRSPKKEMKTSPAFFIIQTVVHHRKMHSRNSFFPAQRSYLSLSLSLYFWVAAQIKKKQNKKMMIRVIISKTIERIYLIYIRI